MQNLASADEIRVHAPLLRERWARLYYYCRAHDLLSRGWVKLSWLATKQDLHCTASTLYEWLAIMKRVGACRSYKRVKDNLTVYLGGLVVIARNLGLQSLGAIATMPLSDLLGSDSKSLESRAIATAIATQQLQESSRYAARRCQRKTTYIPKAEDVLQSGNERSSRLSGKGPMSVARVLHVGKHRIFVSAGFTPFGVSQQAIAEALGISPRTVRRHHTFSGVLKRQLCQAKGAYKEIVAALEWESEEWTAGNVTLHNSAIKEPHSKNLQKVTPNRFFSYMGKTWLLRCNLYFLRYDLIPARRMRRIYKNLIDPKRRERLTTDKQSSSNLEGRSPIRLGNKSLSLKCLGGGAHNFFNEGSCQRVDIGSEQQPQNSAPQPG